MELQSEALMLNLRRQKYGYWVLVNKSLDPIVVNVNVHLSNQSSFDNRKVKPKISIEFWIFVNFAQNFVCNKLKDNLKFCQKCSYPPNEKYEHQSILF